MFRLVTIDGRAALDHDGQWHDLAALSGDDALADPITAVARHAELHDLQAAAATAAPSGAIADATLDAPIPEPRQVFGIGLNYKDHAAEMKKALPAEPLLFIKPPTTVIGPEAEIQLPSWCGRIEHEAEMAVVIGRRASHVKAKDAMDHILGVTCLCDVTARELQAKDVQYSRAKGFDTFGPIGPCIAVGLDPSELEVEGWVNGQKRQHSNTRELIFPIPYIVEWLTRFCTLEPGDVITTGTPPGVGLGMKPEPQFLKPGDVITLGIDGLGEQKQKVVAYKARR